jgi:hypothetical protein
MPGGTPYNGIRALSQEGDMMPVRPLAAPSLGSVAYRAALLLLAAALLVTAFTGRAGVQVIDGAMAARLFAFHLHGVPGEREYVDTYGEPAPFVHRHCHAPPEQSAPQAGPFEVLAAAALAGAVWCSDPVAQPVLPDTAHPHTLPAEHVPDGWSAPPATRPPR